MSKRKNPSIKVEITSRSFVLSRRTKKSSSTESQYSCRVELVDCEDEDGRIWTGVWSGTIRCYNTNAVVSLQANFFHLLGTEIRDKLLLADIADATLHALDAYGENPITTVCIPGGRRIIRHQSF